MKHLLTTLAALCAACLIVASCSGSNSTSNNDSSTGEDTVHTHAHNYWTITEQATCTAPGSRTSYCECGHVMAAEEIAQLSPSDPRCEPAGHTHAHDHWVIIPATCVASGSRTSYCECGHIMEIEIIAQLAPSNPLCEPAGHTHAHDHWVIIPATCAAAGSRTSYCACGHVMEIEVIAQLSGENCHTHAHDNWVITTPATCTEPGSRTSYCSCGHVMGVEEIAQLSPDDPLCKSDSHTHAHDHWVVTTQATCTAPGTRTSYCACGLIMEAEEIAQLSGENCHTHAHDNWVITTPATCTMPGSRTSYCSCGHVMGVEEIARLGHNWGAWEITKTATCNAPGTRTRTCTHDARHVDIEEIGLLNCMRDERDNKNYRITIIGGQNWMAENLNFETPVGSACYDPTKCENHGRYYDWETAMKACPPGWRLPAAQDWDALIEAAGGRAEASDKLKSKTGWDYRNGTDDFGFSALPSGISLDGEFRNTNWSYWWSATESDLNSSLARQRSIRDVEGGMYEGNGDKTALIPVRCTHD